MSESITYSGNGQIRVMGTNQKRTIRKGDTVKRGDIPNDAFDALKLRPDFGGDLDTYRASRRGIFPKMKAEPKSEPKPKAKLKKVKE